MSSKETELIDAIERLRNFYTQVLEPNIIGRNLIISGEDGVNLRLWALRKKLGLSVGEFAARAGVPGHIYRGYEYRGTKVPRSFLKKISAKFSVPLKWLLCEDPRWIL